MNIRISSSVGVDPLSCWLCGGPSLISLRDPVTSSIACRLTRYCWEFGDTCFMSVTMELSGLTAAMICVEAAASCNLLITQEIHSSPL